MLRAVVYLLTALLAVVIVAFVSTVIIPDELQRIGVGMIVNFAAGVVIGWTWMSFYLRK